MSDKRRSDKRDSTVYQMDMEGNIKNTNNIKKSEHKPEVTLTISDINLIRVY